MGLSAAKLFTVATLLFVSTQANAGTFRETVSELQKNCDQDCAQPYHAEKQNGFSMELQQRLRKIAQDQAQIWGDTILENDYVSDGHTRVASVDVLYKNSKKIGYYIEYFENAWYTGECSYDPSESSSLDDCDRGIIHEASFVSGDLKETVTDKRHVADFKPGK